ncbi:acyl-CoA carboxylase subunit beta [Haloimpatiens lingqiaonensis]|uniref:acyl-CoA carboxylase subunit beta n=1 Tax=Haloimpatiens lingqiaonensis TaxID=1380675 RepID=UPI0010FD057B|nr:carboxyl transferase domain-containing protein [Haloimpatiens lingqiaonensis]
MSYVEKFMNVKIQNESASGQKIQAQHNLGKNTCKERMIKLFDTGSFIELGGMISNDGAGVVTGYGTVNRRLVYAYSQDYTVDGGAINSVNANKIASLMDMSVKMGAPLVQILDSAGAKITEGLDILGAYGKILKRNAQNSGVIPQITLVMGPCEGLAALSATMGDFVIITKENSSLCVTPSSKLTDKEKIFIDSKDYSDGESVNQNGSAHIIAENEEEAIETARKILSYIPSNNMDNSPLSAEDMGLNMPKEKLNNIADNENYDIYEIINEISDKESFLEINKKWGQTVFTGLSKINGTTVGILGTNKNIKKGILNIKGIDKLIKFVKVCDGFNIPIISLVDTKGLEIDLKQEKDGMALEASKLLYTLSEATVPKISLIIGEIYGAAYALLASKEVSFDICYAWPSAKISLLAPEDMTKVLFREEIVSSENPRDEEKKIISEHMNEMTNPYVAAEKGYVDDIIMPAETKQRLFAVVDMLGSKREIKYPKKHGSILI